MIDWNVALVGVVSFTDGALQGAFPGGDTKELTAGDVMVRRVVKIGPNAPLQDALELFRKHRIRQLVVAEGPLVQGLMSQWDLLAAMAEDLNYRAHMV